MTKMKLRFLNFFTQSLWQKKVFFAKPGRHWKYWPHENSGERNMRMNNKALNTQLIPS